MLSICEYSILGASIHAHSLDTVVADLSYFLRWFVSFVLNAVADMTRCILTNFVKVICGDSSWVICHNATKGHIDDEV